MFDIGSCKDVYECVDNMLRPVEVTGWRCPACHANVDALTKKYFWTLPK